MQKELEELQPKLVQASAENERMLVVIEKESTEVEATSKVVKQEEKGANEKAAEAQALKDEVCLSVCLSVCLFVWGACTYVHLSVWSACMSICLPVWSVRTPSNASTASLCCIHVHVDSLCVLLPTCAV